MHMRALISVSDKTGIVEFAGALVELGWEVVSTGGTHRYLEEHGIPARKVEELTGFPELLNGRVKTLHPAIHGAILARKPEELNGTGIEPMDMVVVNLYPFEKFADAEEQEMIENIDIGGVALLRAAAKNYERVIVVSAPEQYEEVISLLRSGAFTRDMRLKYAMRAFAITASYDSLIYNTMWRRFSEGLPDHLLVARPVWEKLRYGENPHQQGAFYSSTAPFKQHWGKKLSFNNLSDMDSAYSLVLEFESPAVAVIKHANPCGAAVGETLREAFVKAWSGDPMSAYGSVVAFNGEVDEDTARELKGKYIEVVVAPGYSEAALSILKKKKNLRIIEAPVMSEEYEVRALSMGYLLQSRDTKEPQELRVVTTRAPVEKEMKELLFAWKVVRHVKSNAIVFARDGMVVGVGAGQMSRVDSVKIAAEKAGERARGAVMASDAFFPFRDGIDVAADAGITAVIQPGGSIRDEDVINAANERGLSMVFTGYRVFRH